MAAAHGRPLFGGKSPAPMSWHPLPLMEEWLESLANRGVSLGYIGPAKVGLAHFALFAATEGITHPGRITRHHILRFHTYLTTIRKPSGDPLALTYRNALMRYVRNWLNWLEEVDYIDRNPWVRITVSGATTKPDPLNEDEVALVFAAHQRQAFRISPFSYHRREAMLVLLYGWGLRLHELQSLTVTAMDARLDFVTMPNTGREGSANSRKLLPYASEMKHVVQRWLKARAANAVIGQDALFIDKHGRPLSDHSMRKVITDLGDTAGVRINPSRLRATFGRTMLDHDIPVEHIMRIMGHTQRSQTLAYARVADHESRRSHDRAVNPLIQTLLGGRLPQ